MADESAIIAEWLETVLSAAPAVTALVSTRIYDTDRPEGSAFPCIIFQMQSPFDVNGVGGVRIYVRPLWTVKVIVDDQGYKVASNIFKVIDTTLHNTSGTATDGSIYACVRENDQVRYSEPKPGGGYWRHRGGTYRIEARATNP